MVAGMFAVELLSTNLSFLPKQPLWMSLGGAFYLEASVLGQAEAVSHSCHRMAPICVPGHILIDALQPNLQACASIGQHLQVSQESLKLWGSHNWVAYPHHRDSRGNEYPSLPLSRAQGAPQHFSCIAVKEADLGQVRCLAEIGSCLDCEADAFRARLLAEAHSLGNIARRVAGQRVVQVADEVVPVIRRQGHECAPHQDKFHLKGTGTPFNTSLLHLLDASDLCPEHCFQPQSRRHGAEESSRLTLSTLCPSLLSCSTRARA